MQITTGRGKRNSIRKSDKFERMVQIHPPISKLTTW